MHVDTRDESLSGEGRRLSIPLRITLIYALVGGLWILFSDAVLSILAEDPKIFLRLETVKGWIFIGVTASMLYLLIRRDISLVWRSEDALRRSEERLRLLVENITDYEIFMVDPDGNVASWNTGAELSKGYRPEEVIGKHHSIFFTPEDIRRGVPEQELLIAAKENRHEDDGWRVRKDGTLFWANVVTNAFRDRSGDLLGYVKVVRDITDRKVAEEKIRESEERYRVIAETASDGIITIDEESTIIFVNDSVGRLFGYKASDLLGEPLLKLMPERFRSRHLSGMRRYRETGSRRARWQALEVSGLHKNGREIPLEISYGEFIKEGKHHFTGIVRDVSERKAAEKEREYQLTIERFNWELETLVAERTMSLMALSLADKVRNPASVIGWTIERLFRRDGLPEKSKEEIGIISAEAKKLDAIVKDFQEVLKKKKSMFVYQDVNEVVRGIVPVLEREAVRKRVNLSVRLSIEPLRMNIQPDHFRIALFNLGRNAIEATPEGGTIAIETREEGDRAVIFVSDTGYGIPNDIIGKIFDPFFSTKEYRFGMGLPLIKQIVSQHLGNIKVISDADGGTTFRISFPLRWMERGNEDQN
jgi:PAS domain S-box-containing protein